MPSRFDETVDLGKQVRDSLDLVDDDPVLMAARDKALQALRIRCQSSEKLGFQEVDIDGPGKRPADPGGFAGAAGPEKKEVLSLWSPE
jgi:hypothetical protein